METNERNKEMQDSLQDLLEKNYDAEKGFKQVMEKAANSQLKSWMQKQAAQRSQFANEIDGELRKLNVEPKDSGSAAGSAHRVWIDVKTALSFDKDESILEECIRGEKASVAEYEETLNNSFWTPNVKSMLTEQKNKVQNSLSTVKRLEDLAD
ncbi:ferritin-like domain-containing protein [Gillisia marina]|uniref:ferritin-like domain-containing protein n=1 Tax=Gillisia marina TaxID=1167637 RepID=UPI00029B1709|nr:PA2169 family four-helix-bundle protein [Gillisia marina]